MAQMGSAFNFITYYNTEQLVKEKYGEDDRIEQISVLSAKFSISSNAVWTEAWVEYNELIDEVDLFQLG